ncbi:MAG: serine hydrolase [Bacteroidales bacterium]|nr:serine hydrolase [Bacteroidales bacterium]
MKYYFILTTLLFVNGCKTQPPDITNSDTKYLTDQFENSLMEYKKSEKIEGLSFAIFDNNKTIWQQCLGNSTYGYPITDQTLFSLQSISKNITAMVVR